MKLLLTVFLLFNLSVLSQKVPELKEIMKGPEFIGFLPQNIQWSIDGKSFYFEKESETEKQYFAVSLKDSKKTRIEHFNRLTTPSVERRLLSRNLLYKLHDGKLVALNKNGNVKPLLDLNGRISNIQHVLNENRVYFEMNNNLYRFDITNNYLAQITQIDNENDNGTKKTENYLSSQEKQLFIERKKRVNPLNRKPSRVVISSEGMDVQSIQVSPNEEFVAFRLSKRTQPPYTDVMNFISEDGFAKVQKARPKVGTVAPPEMRFGVYSFEKDTTVLIDFDFLPGLKKAPEYYSEYGRDMQLEENKALIIHQAKFSPNGEHVLISAKSFDNKDRWIISYDLNSNESLIVDHQHDNAWIGGPGISSWNYYSGNLGWIDNERIYYQSEKSGYSHLYSFDITNENKVALTKGNWEVHSAVLSKDGRRFYVTANETNSGNRSFYHLNIDTKELTAILKKDGAYEVQISPDEKQLAFRYSYKNKPWEVYTAKNKKGAKIQQVTNSTSDKFNAYNWTAPDIVDIPTENGLSSKARVYIPADSVKNGAAVIFVHGAGYLQNAHNYWSGYFREYMFHHILLEQGFTILDIDYRASKGYGRDHRTAIYRHMGNADLNDQLYGKKWLIENLDIDAERVGMYGGSYGGFITLMALFKHPGEFKCGGALRSVTDWAHYNHPYTANILNTPDMDSIAYKRSSPIYFADGLTDRLIMFHGMVDDNVQYQDIIRLTQRLIELGKENWDLASYPIEAHSFSTPTSWTDEYRRLLKMFNHELLK